MRWTVCMLALLVAHPAKADIALVIDPDWTVYLVNKGSSPIHCNGYSLETDDGNLKLFDPSTWISIADQVKTDASSVAAALGPGGLSFGEANPAQEHLAELVLPQSYAVFQPGQRITIGKPFVTPVPPPPEFSFFYSDVTAGFANFRVVEGDVIIVPEPSGLVLLAFAGAGLIHCARQARRP